METLVINGLIGLFLVLFGAMAAFPFLVESRNARVTPLQYEDDQVLSIQPVAPPAPRTINPLPVAASAPDRRQAA